MPTVREILEQAGVAPDTINGIDPQVTTALGNVLEAAEAAKQNVDNFWSTVYAPGIDEWQREKNDLARRLATAEAQRAAYERERQILQEQGLVTGDNFGPPKTEPAQPATPQIDPNEFVSRVSLGLSQIADADYKHRQLFNAPMPISPSQLIQEADRLKVSPWEAAERRFGFSKKEAEVHDNAIRAEAEAKVRREFAERHGSNGDMRPATSSRIPDLQRRVASKDLPDPLLLNEGQRRAQAAKMIRETIAQKDGVA